MGCVQLHHNLERTEADLSQRYLLMGQDVIDMNCNMGYFDYI